MWMRESLLLWQKSDNKTLENYVFQYSHAGTYADRREAIEAGIRLLSDPKALDLVKSALNDKFSGLRTFILEQLALRWERRPDSIRLMLEYELSRIASHDRHPPAKAKAIELLGTYMRNDHVNIFIGHLNDSSYSVAGAALTALAKLDSASAYKEAKRQISLPVKGALAFAVLSVLFQAGPGEHIEYVLTEFQRLPFTTSKLRITSSFSYDILKR